MPHVFINTLLIACAVASISFTVTFTSLFEWFRKSASELHPKIDTLVHCPWCFSHWVALIILAFGPLKMPNLLDNEFLNFIALWFAITSISGLIHAVLLKGYEPVAKAKMMREHKKAQENRAS